MKHAPLESMGESLEDREAKEYGVCAQCGRRIVLPCMACQVEVFRRQQRAGLLAPLDVMTSDLSICLESPEQKRYEDVREFREQYGFPMWSAQWYEMIARSACIALDDSEHGS
jgi:hypothetical protein